MQTSIHCRLLVNLLCTVSSGMVHNLIVSVIYVMCSRSQHSSWVPMSGQVLHGLVSIGRHDRSWYEAQDNMIVMTFFVLRLS